MGLYRGDLLPDCYDDWLIEPRARLRRLLLEVRSVAAVLALEAGDHVGAVGHLEAWIQADPICEDAYRQLARTHLIQGERGLARQALERCRNTLLDELGVEPDPATLALEVAIGVRRDQQPAGGCVAPSELVGRQAEWTMLDSLRAAPPEGACLVLVNGEPGVGKTFLAQAFLRHCAVHGWTVAAVRAFAGEGALPYAPILDLLRASPFRAPLDGLPGKHRRALGLLLAELDGSAHSRTGASPADLTRTHLFEAVAHVLTGTGRPLALLVDDLQWCDADTVQLLHYLVRSTRRSAAPVLLLATTRRPHAVVGSLHAVLAGLRALGAVRDVELGLLSSPDAETLVRTRLPDASPSAIDAVVERGSGNPFFLVELASHVRYGTDRVDTLPTAVRTMIASQLHRSSELAATIAQLTAALDTAVDRELLDALIPGRSGEEQAAALDELCQGGFLRSTASSFPSFELRHDLVRDAILDTIGPARLQALHAQIARHVDAAIGAGRSGARGQAAVHCELAGMGKQHSNTGGPPWTTRCACSPLMR